ncbi:MAG: (Fe-S)-binding protein [Opitutaceae bacterium]|jgi:Fe-S oxidoreductase
MRTFLESTAPTVKEKPGFEILYWIGCAASYDPRAQRIAIAMVKLLQHAKINFAILGNEEKCTGDSARRLGDEFLFQELATHNIEVLHKYKVMKIVTHCPHCLNTFVNDYPQLGGKFEVTHHSVFLQGLMADGRLRIDGAGQKPESAEGGALAYHDPCYLARIHGVVDEPRRLLDHAKREKSYCELKRHGKCTSCCGAGGGRMWMEENPDKRISHKRTEEVIQSGADTLATSCPFCMMMMADGLASKGSEIKVYDIAELLARELGLMNDL